MKPLPIALILLLTACNKDTMTIDYASPSSLRQICQTLTHAPDTKSLTATLGARSDDLDEPPAALPESLADLRVGSVGEHEESLWVKLTYTPTQQPTMSALEHELGPHRPAAPDDDSFHSVGQFTVETDGTPCTVFAYTQGMYADIPSSAAVMSVLMVYDRP